LENVAESQKCTIEKHDDEIDKKDDVIANLEEEIEFLRKENLKLKRTGGDCSRVVT